MHPKYLLPVCVCVPLCFALCASEPEAWAGFRGPQRDGVTSIPLEIPAVWPKKLKEVWSVRVKNGYSSPVCNGKHVFIQSREENQEFILALELETSAIGWKAALGKLDEPKIHEPASTPTLAGGALYVFSMAGVVHKLDAVTGRAFWQRNLAGEWKHEGFGSYYGVAASPLIWENLLWLPIGDRESGKAVALKLNDGVTAWESKTAAPGYSSFAVLNAGGAACVATLLHSGCVAFKKDGASYASALSLELQGGTDGNCSSPISLGENTFLITSGEETAAMKFARGAAKPEQVWRINLGGNLSTPVFVNERIYLHTGGDLLCLDRASGKTLSKMNMDAQYCSMVASGKLMVCRLHDGTLKFVSIGEPEMKLLASYPAADEPGESWSSAIPISPKLLVMRLGERLVCLEW